MKISPLAGHRTSVFFFMFFVATMSIVVVGCRPNPSTDLKTETISQSESEAQPPIVATIDDANRTAESTEREWNAFLFQTVDGLDIGKGEYRFDRAKQKELTDDQQRLVQKMQFHAENTMMLRNQAKYEPAARDLETTIAIMYELFGQDYANAISIVPSLADLYERMGQYTLAWKTLKEVESKITDVVASSDLKWQIERLERVMTFSETERQDYDKLQSLKTQMIATRSAGQFPAAATLSQQCHDLARKLFGVDSLEYSFAINNVAACLQDAGFLSESLKLQFEALDRFEKTLGNSIHVVTAQSNIADLFGSQGDFLQAIEWIKRAQATREALGIAPDVSFKCRLAHYYATVGMYTEAEELLVELINSVYDQQSKGINTDTDTLVVLKAFEKVNGLKGNHRKRLEALRRLEPLILKLHGEDSLEYCDYVQCLGVVWYALGDHQKAAHYSQQFKDRIEKIMGVDHLHYANACHNLAHTLPAADPRAQELHETSLRIMTKVYGADSLKAADSWLSLAQLAVVRKDFNQAIEYLRTPLANLAPDSVSHQRTLAYLKNCEAMAYRGLKNYDDAAKAARQSLELFEVSHGPNHQSVSTIRMALSRVYFDAGNLPAADAELSQAFERYSRYVKEAFIGLSEHNRILVIDELRAIVNQSMAQSASDLPELNIQAIYARAVNWKGLVSSLGRAEKSHAKPELKQPLEELKRLRSRYAALALAVPPIDSRDNWLERVQELKIAKEELESKLSEHVKVDELLGQLTVEQVASVIPENVVFVDFFEYERDRNDVHFIDAYVVQRGLPVERVLIGEAKTISKDIEVWRENLQQGGDEFQDAERRLSQRLLVPLLKYLRNKDHLIISPDGVVNRIALHALPIADGKPLLSAIAVSKVVSARQLVEICSQLTNAETSPEPKLGLSLLAVGGVQFEKNQFVPTPDSSIVQNLIRSGFADLPGTAREVVTIEKLFNIAYPQAERDMLEGENADEKAIKDKLSQHPTYVHFATHGFFVPTAEAEFARSSVSTLSNESANVGIHPLLMSGLVFRKPTIDGELNSDDGILTAEEVNSVDLSGTRMVVLSACETGLGNLAGGEGVLGLQRAFYIAGAASLITSLWKVDDAATELLMAEFYRNLWIKKMTRLGALRAAQLKVMQSYDPATSSLRGLGREPVSIQPTSQPSQHLPPAYWAAFELSGDWK